MLVVDCDAQGHAGLCLGVPAGPVKYSTQTFLCNPEVPFAPVSVADGLDVVPTGSTGRQLNEFVKLAGDLMGGAFVTRRALERVAGKYDYVLIDTQPNLEAATTNAMAAGPVLATVQAEDLCVSMVGDLLNFIHGLRLGVAPNAALLGCLPTMCELRNKACRIALDTTLPAAARGGYVFKARIPRATGISTTVPAGRSIFEGSARGLVAVRKAYNEAIDEFVGLAKGFYNE